MCRPIVILGRTMDNALHLLQKVVCGDRFVVVDLEATCWEGDAPAPNEVIEIGAVTYSHGVGVINEFQSFVRPRLRPVLSEFCKNLTHIHQEQVDTAPDFPTAYRAFAQWCAATQPIALVSWGDYDRKQFASDCSLHGIANRIDRHINLKGALSEVMGVGKRGMKGALRLLEIPLEGTHHRGIDDARNIAKILADLILKVDAWRD